MLQLTRPGGPGRRPEGDRLRHRRRPPHRRSPSPSSSTCARAGPRSAPRSSSPPTASPYLRRRRARDQEARPHPRRSASCCSRVIAVALPLYWLAEPGRQADAVEGFEETFVKPGRGALHRGRQLRRPATAPRASAASATLHPHRTERRLRRPGAAGRPRRSTRVLYRYTPRRGARSSSTTAAATRRCRPGARPAAARSPSSSSTTSSTTSEHPAARPRRPRPRSQAELDDDLRARRRRQLHRSPRRASSRPLGEAMFNLGYTTELRRRRLLVRPLPHQGLVLRPARGVRRRRLRPEPDRRLRRSGSSRPPTIQDAFVAA